MGEKKNKKKLKILWKVLAVIVGVWALLLVVMQIVLSPSVLTNLADKLAGDYVDGEVSFGDVRVSVFRSFPNLNVSLSDVSVTYPSDRFPVSDSCFISMQGRGEGVDTLASFSRLRLSVNMGALAVGKIRLPALMLEKPRIFARRADDGSYNWEIFKFSSDTTQQDDSLEIPDFVLGRIALRDHPLIVYSSPMDTIFALADVNRIRFNGRLATAGKRPRRVGIHVDSLIVAGRISTDTLTLELDRLGATVHEDHIDLGLSTTAYMASGNTGRVRIPLNVKTEIFLPRDTVFTLGLREFEANLADIPLRGDVDIRYDGRLYISGNASIDKCKVNDVLDYFRKNVLKVAQDFDTDAVISLTAEFDGYLDPSTGVLPSLSATLDIPRSNIGNKRMGLYYELGLNADAGIDGNGRVNLDLGDFHIKGRAVDLKLNGKAADLLGTDPELSMDASAEISLDTLSQFTSRKSGMSLSGALSLALKGSARLSELDLWQLAQSDITGHVRSDRISVHSEKDSLDFHLDSLNVWLGAVENKFGPEEARGDRILALSARLDSTYMSYKDQMRIVGRGLSLNAQNSAAIFDKSDSSSFYPFGGHLEVDFLSVMGADTTFVALGNSSNTFTLTPKSGNPSLPVLKLDSSIGRVMLRGPVNRIALRELNLDATATMNPREERRRRRSRPDSSMTAVAPGAPRDSLFGQFRRQRTTRELPEWLSEKDFRQYDISIRLSDSLTRYLRNWDFNGSMKLGSAALITPMMPLRNSVRDLSATFNNNELHFHNLSLRSGTSSIAASGTLSGFAPVLTGRGQPVFRLKLDVNSEKLNLNELLVAYSMGSQYGSADLVSLDMEEEDYENMIVTDTLANVVYDEPTPLFVVPANLNAEISIKATDVDYLNFHMESLSAELAMRERCLQMTEVMAVTDVGDLEFEGFYSTRTKSDLKTGFDLQLKDITAARVVELMPAVDSIIPLLRSFDGRLNCVISATASLDTAMNIVMPSLNGVMRITGEDLEFSDSEAFSEIARKLRFKDSSGGHIDHMSVEGYLADSQLELFPFVLNVDRYVLAMSGVQNLDMSFKYHVSVISSPLPFRVGIDISGDFDDFKFKIGQAKYKSADVPVFSTVIDETRINMRESIRDIFQQGVDRAMMQDERRNFIAEYKQRIHYDPAVDMQLDSLSTAEQAQLDEAEEPDEAVEVKSPEGTATVGNEIPLTGSAGG